MIAAALFALFALSSPAHADDDTYCVGGYAGRPPSASMRCNTPAVRARHKKWHFHTWVRLGDQCFACWDEEDNSCETDFLSQHPQWRKVSDPYACEKADTMHVLVAHRARGQDVVQYRPPPPKVDATPAPPQPPPARPTQPRPDPVTPPPKPPTPPPRPDPVAPPAPQPIPVTPPARPDPVAPSTPASPTTPPRPTPPPEPPPKPVTWQPKLVRVSAGPWAAGDPVTLVGRLEDPTGDVRGVPGGSFVLTLPDGSSQTVPGEVQSDGSVVATATLPKAASVVVAFQPDRPRLQRHETLSAPTSAARTLTVSACALRARLVAPVSGAALVTDQAARLAITLEDAAGQPTAAPPDLELRFTLTFLDGPVPGETTDVTAAPGATEAQWTPPADRADQRVQVAAGGNAGARAVCPAPPVSVTVSELGLGLDPSGLPARCWATVPCAGTAALVRPPAGTPARARVDALLADPATEVSLMSGPDVITRGRATPDDRYAFSRTYAAPQHAAWRVVVHGPGGDVALPVHDVDIRPPLDLKLPASLDLGTVVAGTELMEACTPLDFSASSAFQEHRYRVELIGLGDCEAEPVIAFQGAFGTVGRTRLSPAVVVEALDPDRPVLDLCLETSGCAGAPSPDGVHLLVTPETPAFAMQARKVTLTWQVEGRSFLACWAWLLGPLTAGTALTVLVAGFLLPRRFPGHAGVRVAGNLNALQRAAAVPLATLPGAGPGWYRHARLGLQASGEVTRAVATALVVFRAGPGGVEIVGGMLERHDRRTRAWERVAGAADGVLADPAAVYRAGDVLFRLEV